MDKVKKILDPLTCALVILAIFLVVLLFQTRALMEERAGRDAEPSATVIDFLDAYTTAVSVTERENVIETYIDGANGEEKDHDGQCVSLIKFDTIFRPNNREALNYRVCVSQRNYIELMLLDKEGKDQPPRVGLYYRVTGTNKIDSYMVTRLQPLVQSDPEWNEVWQ